MFALQVNQKLICPIEVLFQYKFVGLLTLVQNGLPGGLWDVWMKEKVDYLILYKMSLEKLNTFA